MSEDRLYFLSYSRSDERVALRFADDLRSRGVNIWVDQYEIRPSQHWDRAIERAVQDCQGLVVMLSPRSVASENVADEISYAIDSGKTVIPVLIEKCTVPLRVTRMHMLDATRDYDAALRQCLAEMTRAAGGDGPSPPISPPAPASTPAVGAEQISEAERRLTPFMGPMAGRLVKQAAARAVSLEEFHRALAEHLPEGGPREHFLAAFGASPARRLIGARDEKQMSPEQTEELIGLLTRYLGPIAPLMVKREIRNCVGIGELRLRLSEAIPAPKDRAEFLRRSQNACV